MDEIAVAVRCHLNRMRGGAREDAFFGLLDLGPKALPFVISAASAPTNRDIRASLVEVIWQYRRPEAIGFLGAALDDMDPEVWKQAIDGLVALGGPDAVQRIREAMKRPGDLNAGHGASEDWLREALEQIDLAAAAKDSAQWSAARDPARE